MPTGSRDLDEGDHAELDVGVGEGDPDSLAVPRPPRPRAREAVGLLLGVHRRHVTTQSPLSELDCVAELVGHHDRDDRRSELLGQPEDHPVFAVVVRHEVAVRAVQRTGVDDVLVRRVLTGSAPGDRGRALRIRGVDPAPERLVDVAVEHRVLLAPPLLDVLERGCEVAVVEALRLGVTDVDDVVDRWPVDRSGRGHSGSTWSVAGRDARTTPSTAIVSGTAHAVSEHAPASTVKIERRATGPECTAGRQSSAVAAPGSCASSSTISSA